MGEWRGTHRGRKQFIAENGTARAWTEDEVLVRLTRRCVSLFVEMGWVLVDACSGWTDWFEHRSQLGITDQREGTRGGGQWAMISFATPKVFWMSLINKYYNIIQFFF